VVPPFDSFFHFAVTPLLSRHDSSRSDFNFSLSFARASLTVTQFGSLLFLSIEPLTLFVIHIRVAEYVEIARDKDVTTSNEGLRHVSISIESSGRALERQTVSIRNSGYCSSSEEVSKPQFAEKEGIDVQPTALPHLLELSRTSAGR
jgi:predicted Zn-ribbon and HTH transcriptional regulator